MEDSKPSVSEVPEAGSVTNANKMDGTSDNVDRKELLRLVEQKRLEIVAASQASASSGELLFCFLVENLAYLFTHLCQNCMEVEL